MEKTRIRILNPPSFKLMKKTMINAKILNQISFKIMEKIRINAKI